MLHLTHLHAYRGINGRCRFHPLCTDAFHLLMQRTHQIKLLYSSTYFKYIYNISIYIIKQYICIYSIYVPAHSRPQRLILRIRCECVEYVYFIRFVCLTISVLHVRVHVCVWVYYMYVCMIMVSFFH